MLTGLIFLVVLTLLTLSAIKATSLEERMAGNARDQDVAFQAAEAAIRDAMVNVLPTLKTTDFVSASCANGLCLNSTTTPVWKTITTNNDWNSAKTRAYSGAALTMDGASPLPSQPRFIVELLPEGSISGFSMAKGKGITSGSTVTPYRVTARGWGLTTQAQATVQSAVNY
ncbi:MAG: hypothetical protein IV085_08505 [Thiobacillus sp.]|nr:hypothetical protein [Thiobacillus sp.]